MNERKDMNELPVTINIKQNKIWSEIEKKVVKGQEHHKYNRNPSCRHLSPLFFNQNIMLYVPLSILYQLISLQFWIMGNNPGIVNKRITSIIKTVNMGATF